MAALTGNSINTSYQGLLKTDGNGSIPTVATPITDGTGVKSGLEIGNNSGAYQTIVKSDDLYTNGFSVDGTGTNFGGAVDFSAATVTGLPAGGGGLVAGTGTDSMESDASLTTNAADAQGNNSIALGDNAKAFANNSIVIGTSVNDADAVRFKAISIGNNLSTAQYTVNIGLDQNAYGASGVCIGENNTFGGDFNAAIGYDNSVTVYNHQGVFGSQSSASATGAYAIGHGVNATTQETVSVKALETQTPSTPTAGGIIITDAGSTARRLNITASGTLQVDGGGVGLQPHPARSSATGLYTTTAEGPYTFFSNTVFFMPIYLHAGEEVADLEMEVVAAFTSTSTIEMALYSAQRPTDQVNFGAQVPYENLGSFGSFDATTIGIKTLTSSVTVPYSGTYFIGFNMSGQWDGTLRQCNTAYRYGNDTANSFFMDGTNRRFSAAAPIECHRLGAFGSTFQSTYAASTSWDTTSIRLYANAQTAQNI